MIERQLQDISANTLEAAAAVSTQAGLEVASSAWIEVLFGMFLVTLFALMLVEKFRPANQIDKAVAKRSYVTNLLTFVMNDATLSLLQIPVIYVVASDFTGLGLLSRMEPGIGTFLLSLALLDLTLYVWHYYCHHCETLWTLHRVHHSDDCMNVTTGLRYHLGELILEALLRATFIIITGVDMQTMLICQSIVSVFVLAHHANVQYPAERILRMALIMPSLHRIHHSTLRVEHDSNFGSILSLWDRLFGTLKVGQPVAIGIRDFDQQTVWGLIKLGCGFRSNHSPSLESQSGNSTHAVPIRSTGGSESN